MENTVRTVEVEKREMEASSKSQHISSVGDKVELILVLTKISTYSTSYTYYGETHYIYNFVDEYGNVLVWKTSKAPDELGYTSIFDDELKENSIVTVKGTIKEHSEYNGIPQTVLTRCKIK